MRPGARGSRQADPIVREVAERLRERFGPHIRRSILFGSRARGDHEGGADYDVLVLVDKKTRDLEAGLFDLECEISSSRDVCVSVLVEEEAAFDRRRYEPLFMNVRREGVPL